MSGQQLELFPRSRYPAAAGSDGVQLDLFPDFAPFPTHSKPAPTETGPLSRGAARLLARVASLALATGQARLKDRTLATYLNISDRTVRRYRKRLREAELITVRHERQKFTATSVTLAGKQAVLCAVSRGDVTLSPKDLAAIQASVGTGQETGPLTGPPRRRGLSLRPDGRSDRPIVRSLVHDLVPDSKTDCTATAPKTETAAPRPATPPDPADRWANCLAALSKTLPTVFFESFIAPLEYRETPDGRIELQAADDRLARRIGERYQMQIEQALGSPVQVVHVPTPTPPPAPMAQPLVRKRRGLSPERFRDRDASRLAQVALGSGARDR